MQGVEEFTHRVRLHELRYVFAEFVGVGLSPVEASEEDLLAEAEECQLRVFDAEEFGWEKESHCEQGGLLH